MLFTLGIILTGTAAAFADHESDFSTYDSVIIPDNDFPRPLFLKSLADNMYVQSTDDEIFKETITTDTVYIYNRQPHQPILIFDDVDFKYSLMECKDHNGATVKTPFVSKNAHHYTCTFSLKYELQLFDSSANKFHYIVEHMDLDFKEDTGIFSMDYSFDTDEQCGVKLSVNDSDRILTNPYPSAYTFVGGDIIRNDAHVPIESRHIVKFGTPIEIVPCNAELKFALQDIAKSGESFYVGVFFYKVGNDATSYDDSDIISSVAFNYFSPSPPEFCRSWVDKNLVIDTTQDPPEKTRTCYTLKSSAPIVEPPTLVIKTITSQEDVSFMQHLVVTLNPVHRIYDQLLDTDNGSFITPKINLTNGIEHVITVYHNFSDDYLLESMICLNNGNPFVVSVYETDDEAFVFTPHNGDNIVCTFTYDSPQPQLIIKPTPEPTIPPKATILLVTDGLFFSTPAFEFELTSVEKKTINVSLTYNGSEAMKDFTLTDGIQYTLGITTEPENFSIKNIQCWDDIPSHQTFLEPIPYGRYHQGVAVDDPTFTAFNGEISTCMILFARN